MLRQHDDDPPGSFGEWFHDVLLFELVEFSAFMVLGGFLYGPITVGCWMAFGLTYVAWWWKLAFGISLLVAFFGLYRTITYGYPYGLAPRWSGIAGCLLVAWLATH